jgi:hypothetical protein
MGQSTIRRLAYSQASTKIIRHSPSLFLVFVYIPRTMKAQLLLSPVFEISLSAILPFLNIFITYILMADGVWHPLFDNIDQI